MWAPPGAAPESLDAWLSQVSRGVEQHRKGDIHLRVMDAGGRPIAGLEVALEQTTHDFRFGSIAFELLEEHHFTPVQEALFKARFARLFNQAVLPFYWDGYEHVPGRPAWEKTLEVATWCNQNGITPKGHPLAWTHVAGMPGWLHELPLDASRALLEARILGAVKGFAGTIDLWDVANEAANTVTWDVAMRMSGRVEDQRYPAEGDSIEAVADWVEPCYRAAHAANPRAILLLNDFGQIAWPPVRERFFALVKELQRRGTPLDGIGLQAHEPRTEWFHPQKVWETFDRLAELGLPIHITEFHPRSLGEPITGDYRQGSWTEDTQAEFARMMATLAFAHPSVVSFTWWDFTERDSYIKGSALLREDLSPKPAYQVLDDLINTQWKTHARLKTDADGRINLRGFYGEYAVRVDAEGARPSTFRLTRDATAESTIRIGGEK